MNEDDRPVCSECGQRHSPLGDVAAQMADTMRAVLGIVDTQPDYPWDSGALKRQMREDLTAYDLLGLDTP